MSFDDKFRSASYSFNSSGACKYADEFGYVLQLNPREGSVDQLQVLISAMGWDNDVKIISKEVRVPGTVTSHTRAFALFKDKALAEGVAEHFWAVNKEIGVMVPERIELNETSGETSKTWKLKSARL